MKKLLLIPVAVVLAVSSLGCECLNWFNRTTPTTVCSPEVVGEEPIYEGPVIAPSETYVPGQPTLVPGPG